MGGFLFGLSTFMAIFGALFIWSGNIKPAKQEDVKLGIALLLLGIVLAISTAVGRALS